MVTQLARNLSICTAYIDTLRLQTWMRHLGHSLVRKVHIPERLGTRDSIDYGTNPIDRQRLAKPTNHKTQSGRYHRWTAPGPAQYIYI